MGRKPASASAAAPQSGTPSHAMTKADAVRAAIADGADKPIDGAAYIKEKFGLDVTPQQFSTYKSLAKKKGGQEGHGKRGRKPAAKPAAASSANGPKDVVQALEAIKALVNQLGVDQVQRIAEIFRK